MAEPGATVSASGYVVTVLTHEKSFTGSNGSVFFMAALLACPLGSKMRV